jgi:hypothetical protein
VRELPVGKNVGRRAENIGEDSRQQRFCACCGELQSVWINDSAIVTACESSTADHSGRTV